MTTTYNITRDAVINSALRLMGVLSDGETAGANDITNMADTLNLMLKEWASKGKKPWAVKQLNFAFVDAKVSWTIGPSGDVTPDRPQVVLDCWWQDSSQIRRPMFKLPRERFFKLSPANQKSTAPTNWYYDAQLTNGVWYPWPLCDGTNGTFYMDAQFALQDVLNSNDPILVAPSVFNAVKWGLADESLTDYSVHPDIARIIMKKAPVKIESAMDLEEEQDSVFFQPRMLPGQR